MLLDLMFEQSLNDAEVKAIARGRGFQVGDHLSRSVVKNYFLTPIGVEEMLKTLTQRELAVLWMMASDTDMREVDVSFFERLYHDPAFSFTNVYMLSFNQRYKDVLKEVRERLVRKGLLLFAPDLYSSSLKIEQWRFRFPDEFHAKLPPLVTSLRLEGPDGSLGEVHEERVRKKVLQLVGEVQNDPLANDPNERFWMEKGALMWGKAPFKLAHFYDWQMNCWVKSLAVKVLSSEGGFHPVKSIIECARGFTTQDWLDPQQLAPVLEVQCFGLEVPGAEQILAEGWQWGLFARRAQGGKTLYSPRFPTGPRSQVVLRQPLEDLIQHDDRKAWVDLRTIPPVLLSDLNTFCEFRREKTSLFVEVADARLAQALPQLEGNLLARWLREHIRAFDQTFQTFHSRWGKIILHENLLVARIADFHLKLQFERAFTLGQDYIPLEGEWVAFRKDLLEDVEKLVHKSNHIIRRVMAAGVEKTVSAGIVAPAAKKRKASG